MELPIVYLEQQIPRNLQFSQEKFNLLGREQQFFEKIESNKELKKYVFNYEGIINKEHLPDIWSVYRVEQARLNPSGDGYNFTNFMSLQDCLFSQIELHKVNERQ